MSFLGSKMVHFVVGAVLSMLVGIRAYNLLTGRHAVRDPWDKLCLSRRTIAAWDVSWAENSNRSDVVVCLTTTPSRISRVESTLKSLLYQSRSPQTVRLHIPMFSRREQRMYVIPPYLAKLQAVEIVPCEDYGPVTKLIPALQELEPDQKILVVDDDRLYPPNMIEDFFRWSNEHPNIAIGLSGWIVPEDLTDRPLTLLNNLRKTPPAPIKSTRLKEKKRVDVLMGYTGYLVRPTFFDVERVADYSGAPEAAFYVDDVWTSAHCNVPKYVFPAKRHCFISRRDWPFFDKTALYRLSDGGGDPEKRHNTIMIRYFRDRWMR